MALGSLGLTLTISLRIKWDRTMTVFFLTVRDSSLRDLYICSVQGSTKFGNLEAKSPKAIIVFDLIASFSTF